jgi:hypothetical protein
MATATKNRRGKGKAAGKDKSKAAAKAQSNGGEKLTVAERRLEGHSVGDRRKAVKLANSDGIAAAADLLGESTVKAKYLVMQQQVEDGDVPAIKPTDEKAILKALKAGDEYSSVAWVACRTGLADGKVKAIAEAAGHSFDRGRPSGGGGTKTSSKATAKGKGKTGSASKARRGGKNRRGRRGSSPNA